MSASEIKGSKTSPLAGKDVALRVSRPVSACLRCRSAKTKCDGKVPACTTCEKAGRSKECSNADVGLSKGRERSYVACLEKRVEWLEKQIASIGSQCEAISSQEMGNEPTSENETSTSKPDQRATRREFKNVDDLVSDFGFLSVNATARDFHGVATDASFAGLVLTSSLIEALPSSIMENLPPRHIATKHIQYYIENIHIFYPFLPESKIFSALSAAYDMSGTSVSHIDRWIILMVIAVSLAAQATSREDPLYRTAVDFASTALRHAEMVFIPGSIAGVQALLLLVLYAMWDPRHFNSWYLMGAASRVMVDLGLHLGKPLRAHKDSDSQFEQQIRIFQSVYTLDRSISMVNGRSFSFTDASADSRNFVFESKSGQSPLPFTRNLKSAAEILRLRRLQSSYYQRLHCSERLTGEQMWPVASKALSDLDEYSKGLADGIDPKYRQLFKQEIHFSRILMLNQLNSVGIHTFTKKVAFLVVQYARSYIEILHEVLYRWVKPASYNSHDLLRASLVSTQYIAALQTLMVCSKLNPSVVSLSSEDFTHTSKQAILSTLDKMETCLKWFCLRFGYQHPLLEFQSKAEELKLSMHS